MTDSPPVRHLMATPSPPLLLFLGSIDAGTCASLPAGAP
eukprot:CAMPEP_0183360354 /NCGR_PEP_ID=MMETSP0164_2-20130417/54972_1 /TAXON_ID=221442 /ORGANISM="Coccolithus pelagicus ssp braarudi, Strain PLY182g" /LENGTH=38 /DNA_ID= /DNA_START= /DNA_END= /DNA_ORIENTATION=